MRRRRATVYEGETWSPVGLIIVSLVALFLAPHFGFDDFLMFLSDLICLGFWLALLGVFVHRWVGCFVLEFWCILPTPQRYYMQN